MTTVKEYLEKTANVGDLTLIVNLADFLSLKIMHSNGEIKTYAPHSKYEIKPTDKILKVITLMCG